MLVAQSHMDRAAIGLGSVFLHLRAEINWHRLFEELIQDFDAKRLKRRQAAALKKAQVPLPIVGCDRALAPYGVELLW